MKDTPEEIFDLLLEEEPDLAVQVDESDDNDPNVPIADVIAHVKNMLLKADGEHNINLWTWEHEEKAFHEQALEALDREFELTVGSHLSVNGHEMTVVEEQTASTGGGYVYLKPLTVHTSRPTTKQGWTEWWKEELAKRGTPLVKAVQTHLDITPKEIYVVSRET